MTRQEQLKQRLAKQQERLAKERQDMLAAEGALRTEERRLLNKRRYHVGALADEAGILDQETPTLVEGFALLARLLEQGALQEVLAIYPPEEGQVGGLSPATLRPEIGDAEVEGWKETVQAR